MSLFDDSWSTLPQPAPHMKTSGHYWRMDPPVMDGRKVVTGGMFEHQREYWELPNFIKLLVGGYGSGKTVTLCKRAVASALHNAPVPVCVVSPSYSMAKLTTVPTLEILLNGKQSLLGRDFRWRNVLQPPPYFEIFYRGRHAKIFVLSGERPQALKGGNLAAAFIDEPFIQDQAVFEQVIARVRHPTARKLEISLTGTPESLNWGYDLCEGELGDRYDVGVVHASTYDNLTLPEDYADRLARGYDAQAVEAFVQGRFVNLATGRVYYTFSRDEHVIARRVPDNAKIGVGMDFNVNPMAFVLFWFTETELHVIKDYELPNSDTEYACHVLREHELIEDRVVDVFPDPSCRQRHTNAPGGVSDFTILKDQGFAISTRNKHPAIRDRYNAVNGKFKPSKGRISLTVDPSCKRLIKYLEQYTHEEINKQKHMSHLLDALGYPIEFMWPVTKNQVKQLRYHGA